MSHSPQFIHQTEPQTIHRGHRRAKAVRWLVVILAALFFVWLCVSATAGLVVWAAVTDGIEATDQVKGSLKEGRIQEAKEQLEITQRSFARARRGFILLVPSQVMPVIGSYIKTGQALAATGEGIAQTLIEVVELGEELVRLSGLNEQVVEELAKGIAPEMTFNDLSAQTKEAMLTRLHGAAPVFERTLARTDIARQRLVTLQRESDVFGLDDQLRQFDTQLAQVQDGVRLLSVAARSLPYFGGLDQERSHLLLFLNNGELRPGGGFVGTYGILKAEGGDIVDLDTTDVYTLDNAAEPFLTEQPPVPLQEYNASDVLFFRDANWSPDFATSARLLIDQFEKEVAVIPRTIRPQVQPPVEIDGVIGFTPTFASELLRITGPLSVGGQTFDAENVFDKIEFQVEFGFAQQGIPVAQRKEILSELVIKMKEALFALPFAKWPEVFLATQASITNKQFVLFAQDDRTQSLLKRFGLAGEVSAGVTDVQMVVDANLASLKSDPAVKRTIHYEIGKNTAGAYVGRTTIRYEHTGGFDWKTTRYRTYTRLYTPKDTQFVRSVGSLKNDKIQNPTLAPGEVDVFEELGMTAFGAFISIEPGETRQLVFEYELAPSVEALINSREYRLRVLKQIGALDHALTLTLDFDKNLSHATPAEAADQWGDDLYRLNTILDQDREIVVEL